MLRVIILIISVLPVVAFSLPENATVNGGQVVFHQHNNVFEIHQQSGLASINYDSFNIQSNEIVNFIQPDANAIALNRVTGNNPSQILGQLNSNGQVFLVNPNGILFGSGSSINVGGLFATTLNISDSDFFSRRFSFDNQGNAASIDNYGVIQGNYIALVSPKINNFGELSSDMGTVHLHAADAVEVSFSDGINIETTASSYDAVINNYGTISASGGRVVLNASARNELIETVVNNEGVIRANGIKNSNGRIFLVAQEKGDVINTGTIDASAIEKNINGGEIVLSGQRVAQLAEVRADGSGNADGGIVHIKADKVVALGENSFTTANAGVQGKGGEVIALSPQTTLFNRGGIIRATGGIVSGNGGYVDVSGWQHVEVLGNVDVSATEGEHGIFLIDPIDLTITNAVDTNITAATPFQPTATGSILDFTTLNAALTGGANIEVRTDVAGADAGDLTINNVLIDFDGNNGGSLLFFASGSIIFNNGAQIVDSLGADDVMDITLTAGNEITFGDNTRINTGGGNFVSSSGGATRVLATSIGGNSLITSGAGTISITTGGNLRLGGLLSTNATNSAITLNVTGDITDGGEVFTDIDAVNGRTNITAQGSFQLETNMNQVSLNFTGTAADITNAGALDIVGGSTVADLTVATTAGDLTVSGNLDLNGANTSTLTLNANQNLNISAGVTIGDLTAADDNVNINLNAGNQLVMADGSLVDAVGGQLNVSTVSDAVISSLKSTSTSNTAITMNVGANLLDGGDLLLADIDAVNGGVSLTVAGNIETPANLEVNVDRLNMSLSGGNANISEINGVNITGVTGVSTLNIVTQAGDITIFGDIDLDGSNGNTYTLTSAQDIIINDAVSIADVSNGVGDNTNITLIANRNITMGETSVIDATGGLISITADNDANNSGDAILSKVTTVSAANNAMVINAENIIDGSAFNDDLLAVNGRLTLNANANIAGGPGGDIDINVNQLVVSSASNGDVNINQGNNTLNLISATGINNLTLAANNSIIIPDAGLSVTGNANITAGDLVDAGVTPRDLVIAAQALALNLLNPAGSVSLMSNISSLDVTLAGANRNLLVTEADNINILGLNGINDFTLDASSGAVTIPDAGLNLAGNLTINSQDIIDSDRNINLTAGDAVFIITSAAGDLSINSNFDRLDASIIGGSLSINEANRLQIENFDNSNTTAINISDGNFSARVQSGDLIINDTVQAQDTIADGVRSGMIDLRVDNGDAIIGGSGSTTIQSINTVDQNTAGGLNGNQESIRIYNPDTGDINSNIVFGDGIGNDVQITSQGGDVLISNNATQLLTSGNTRNVTINTDVTINAYNQLNDPLTGNVNISDEVLNNGTTGIGSSRSLTVQALRATAPAIPEGGTEVAENIVSSVTQQQIAPEQVPTQPSTVTDSQIVFNQVFNACDSVNSGESQKKCGQEKVIQNFLNSLLIGGNLPEIKADDK